MIYIFLLYVLYVSYCISYCTFKHNCTTSATQKWNNNDPPNVLFIFYIPWVGNLFPIEGHLHFHTIPQEP